MKKALFILGMTIAIALPTAAQQKIEQIVARVNGDIILKSEMDHELDVRRFEMMKQPGMDPTKLEQEMADESKVILRDLIDRALLLQIAKEAGLNADTDVEKTMEDLRVQQKFETREELEKAIIKDYGDPRRIQERHTYEIPDSAGNRARSLRTHDCHKRRDAQILRGTQK
jgi:parvulin-like peptidyl-prolyl isomerase